MAVAPLNQRTRVFNPLRGGISIFNPLRYTYGTLGAKVIDRNTGAEMLLSNWHVLAGAWYAPAGMEIYQPVRAIWNGSNQRIARLSRNAMSQGLDAAVAEMTGNRTIINHQYELGQVTGVIHPERGLQVVKSGRTTGVTYGVITGVDGYRVENYDGRRQIIRNIIHIAQAPEGGAVSSAGDSGSIWMEQSTNRAVGLHFAGSDAPEYGLALALPHVLEALQVNLATT
jgi:endonuclease G